MEQGNEGTTCKYESYLLKYKKIAVIKKTKRDTKVSKLSGCCLYIKQHYTCALK